MDSRFYVALGGLIVFVGGGAAWFIYQVFKRKKMTQSLLSLSKERRFFWHKLKDTGYTVHSLDVVRDFEVLIDGIPTQYSLKADYIVKKDGKKYLALYFRGHDEREMAKLFYIYLYIYDVRGVLFMDEQTKTLSVWEENG